MRRRIEVQIVGDAISLKRAFGEPLTFVERVRYAWKAAHRAWKRSA